MTDRAFDDSFNKRNLFVADEDKVVVEDIDPMVFPDSSIKEVFVPGDAQIAAYRQYIKDWQARGWRIDSRKVEADKGRVGYAIPSPARRESRNFPLDAVPLLPAESAGRQPAVAAG